MTNATLVYLFRGNEILLAMKKRGFGVGKWNGVGGKVHDGETFTEAAIRETKEEIGVDVQLEAPLGEIHFHDATSEWMVHVFRTETFSGEPVETEEMRPQWFSIDAIPYAESWEDDQYWLPLLIAGKKFTAEVRLDAENHVTECNVVPV
jgi:8-oxo-dGTP pyrophosphatase MutT (NUDIX family)